MAKSDVAVCKECKRKEELSSLPGRCNVANSDGGDLFLRVDTAYEVTHRVHSSSNSSTNSSSSSSSIVGV